MNKRRNLLRLSLVGSGFFFVAALFAQSPADKKLLVNGKNTGVTVLQAEGRFYIDIETLARITRGTVTVEPTQIVLTIPSANSDATSAQTKEELSRDFVSAAIVALSEMREWKGALRTMVTYGLAVDGSGAQTYREQAETSMAQAAVEASTSADRNALQLLNNEFAHLSKWENDVFENRKVLNGAETIDPNALQNDPALTKISDCGRFLNTMLVGRTFADNSSCN